MAEFDLAIIGGGINGVGIARDAAGRGLRVLLVEQNDLASGTSSASTKLIHGGLRYLEHGALRLVREALAEREVLLRMAPHLIRPMRFVVPPNPNLYAASRLRLGLFLYDRLGGRKILPATRTLDLTHHIVGAPLKRRYRFGFEYSDCWVDDARLVVLNAVDAAERGAVIRTRTRCVRAEREESWRLILKAKGQREVVSARALVNAAGPWVADVAETVLRAPAPGRVRLDKGSHIVVPRLFEHDRGYLLPTADRRVVFALPFERDFTMIGTTDAEFAGDPGSAVPTLGEIDYLCDSVSEYFRERVGSEDVVWAFAGVRALYDDGTGNVKDTTRDYQLDLQEHFHEAPLLTVYGGKITTYRRLAEAALGRLRHFFKLSAEWTSGSTLPGGDFVYDGADALVTQARQSWPFLAESNLRRLIGAYGTRLGRVLGSARDRNDLGPWFGDELSAAEVRYLVRHEWARTAEDVLWRRSKLGLRLTQPQSNELVGFMANIAG